MDSDLTRLFTTEVLRNRHRLSLQQIEILGFGKGDSSLLEEKVEQLGWVQHFMGISELFDREGIWFVPLKGPLLSQKLYGDPTVRISRDFDFLVEENQVGLVIRKLENLGYYPENFPWPENIKRQKFILKQFNQFSLVHVTEKASVEVHWRLLDYPVVPYDKINGLARLHLEKVTFNGHNFRQFLPEFELLYLIIHGSLHAWFRLKWLVDVKEFLSWYAINKETFESLVKQLHAQRVAGLCNRMLKEFFPGTVLLPVNYDIPEWFSNFSISQTMREVDRPTVPPANFVRYIWFRMQAFPGLRYKINTLRLFSVSDQDIKHTWIPPFLIFYLLYRPFGYIYRYFQTIFKR